MCNLIPTISFITKTDTDFQSEVKVSLFIEFLSVIMKGPLLLTSGLSFIIWKSRHILTFYFPSDERVPPKKCTFAVLVIYVRMGMVKKIQFNDIFHEITRISFSHSNLASYWLYVILLHFGTFYYTTWKNKIQTALKRNKSKKDAGVFIDMQFDKAEIISI